MAGAGLAASGAGAAARNGHDPNLTDLLSLAHLPHTNRLDHHQAQSRRPVQSRVARLSPAWSQLEDGVGQDSVVEPEWLAGLHG